ncbi:MAG: 4a-hydroxytetrahydrobiopterin dehydratase [Candidatus Handelsmanbacteria bacterium]|nr:4a-hydroxytetrahydrobiopterin dehydratase [Candidatus Handelsmanbacteria bacterium]
MATEDKTGLTPAQIDEELRSLEGWSRSESVISRAFVFRNYRDLTSFLNHLTQTITSQNHHPDFGLNTGMRLIWVALTTHSKKALTRSDLNFARTLNSWTPGA